MVVGWSSSRNVCITIFRCIVASSRILTGADSTNITLQIPANVLADFWINLTQQSRESQRKWERRIGLMDRAVGSDLNHAMREAARPHITKLRYQFAELEKHADLALAARLAEKHGKRLCESDSAPAVATSSWEAVTNRLEQNSSEQLTIFSPAD